MPVQEEQQVKAWVREALIEMLQERHSEFYALVREVLEDVALGHAIHEGHQKDYVAEEDIKRLLKSGVSEP